MAYLKTTATSSANIIDSIQSFADSLGFTTEFHGNTPSGQRMVSMSGAGLGDYAHFFEFSDSTGVNSMRSISINVGADWQNQPERSDQSSTNLVHAGPYVNLYLFGETGANPYIHCVIEFTAGHFRHVGIGEMIKTGTWVGGSYSYGTHWDQGTAVIDIPNSTSHGRPFSINNYSNEGCAVRCDDCDADQNNITGVDNRYLTTDGGEPSRFDSGAFASGSTQGVAGGYSGRHIGAASFTSPNYFNNRVILAPFGCWCTRASGRRTYIGEPPAMRVASIEPFVPAEELTVGSDVWKIFPVARKNYASDDTEASHSQAIAYLKVT